MSSPRTIVRITRALAALAVAGVGIRAVLIGTRGPHVAAEPARYHEGEVTAVDDSASTITLREGLGTRAPELRVIVGPDTRITHGSTLLPLAEVHPGDHATVRVDSAAPRGAPPVAAEIRLARGPVGDEDDGGGE